MQRDTLLWHHLYSGVVDKEVHRCGSWRMFLIFIALMGSFLASQDFASQRSVLRITTRAVVFSASANSQELLLVSGQYSKPICMSA